MRKKIFSILAILIITVFLSGCAYCEKKSSQDGSNIDILTLMSSKSNLKNKIWVGTFQLAFNDMKNNVIKKDVKFAGEKMTRDLKGLNNEEFTSSMLDEASYYTSWGVVRPEAKIEIENGIMKKFKEKSDVLDDFDWSYDPLKYYAYAMLKKEFEFLNEFDKLDNQGFNNSKEKYKYFGISENSKKELYDNVAVLFYNNENDYAVRLLTKQDDYVYLYRTDKNEDFKTLFEKMKKQAQDFKGSEFFSAGDTLLVPELDINTKKEYKELCNKKIEGTNAIFSRALETVQLKLDAKGGKVKSEAVIMLAKCSLRPVEEKQKPRHFKYDKTFTMFLVDQGKEDPYLALRIQDLKNLQSNVK